MKLLWYIDIDDIIMILRWWLRWLIRVAETDEGLAGSHLELRWCRQASPRLSLAKSVLLLKRIVRSLACWLYPPAIWIYIYIYTYIISMMSVRLSTSYFWCMRIYTDIWTHVICTYQSLLLLSITKLPEDKIYQYIIHIL